MPCCTHQPASRRRSTFRSRTRTATRAMTTTRAPTPAVRPRPRRYVPRHRNAPVMWRVMSCDAYHGFALLPSGHLAVRPQGAPAPRRVLPWIWAEAGVVQQPDRGGCRRRRDPDRQARAGERPARHPGPQRFVLAKGVALYVGAMQVGSWLTQCGVRGSVHRQEGQGQEGQKGAGRRGGRGEAL